MTTLEISLNCLSDQLKSILIKICDSSDQLKVVNQAYDVKKEVYTGGLVEFVDYLSQFVSVGEPLSCILALSWHHLLDLALQRNNLILEL
jgi:hypothetical protein